MTADAEKFGTTRLEPPDGSDSRDFEDHIPTVFDRAYRLTRNRELAMDIVQDVYIKWNRQCRGEAPQHPRAWLRTVTTRRVFELSRGPHLRLVSMNDDVERATAPDSADQDILDGDILRDDVMQALAELSDQQREVLLAKIMDKLSFSAISEAMAISVSTAKTHYLRAVTVLRDQLAPRWRDP